MTSPIRVALPNFASSSPALSALFSLVSLIHAFKTAGRDTNAFATAPTTFALGAPTNGANIKVAPPTQSLTAVEGVIAIKALFRPIVDVGMGASTTSSSIGFRRGPYLGTLKSGLDVGMGGSTTSSSITPPEAVDALASDSLRRRRGGFGRQGGWSYDGGVSRGLAGMGGCPTGGYAGRASGRKLKHFSSTQLFPWRWVLKGGRRGVRGSIKGPSGGSSSGSGDGMTTLMMCG
jgi:hypothetical protein